MTLWDKPEAMFRLKTEHEERTQKQEILEPLQERENVNSGAYQETIERCTYPHKYKKRDLPQQQAGEAPTQEATEEQCTICLCTLEEGED
ncbi:E3 ubiquitin-protein ligase RNF165 [Manis javanica]|nr:E3 ubiquitin-protein ligase RNF165 [Manis javanica]